MEVDDVLEKIELRIRDESLEYDQLEEIAYQILRARQLRMTGQTERADKIIIRCAYLLGLDQKERESGND